MNTTLRACLRPSLRSIPTKHLRASPRTFSTLESNHHIKVFPNQASPNSYLLTYLSTSPPSRALAIGTSTTLPPTPRTFTENPRFLAILNEVLEQHAHNDPDLISQARVFAGPGGGTFLHNAPTTGAVRGAAPGKMAADTGAGGASAQGGAGGAHRGGHIHLSDSRNPPDYGRIAWPEDILGSIEVDGEGNIVGRLEPSGTYRILTNDGILEISEYLREKVIQRLQREENEDR